MRAPALDLLRAASAVMVVLLHVAALTLTDPASPPATWLAAHLLDSLCRPAVPLFVMISGALLLPACRPGPAFLLRRLRRLALPLALAAAGYLLLRLCDTPAPGARALAAWLLTGSLWYHLWYLYMLPGLYLLLPFAAALAARSTRAAHALCALLLALAAAATLVGAVPAPTLLRGAEFLGYALAGHLLWQGPHALRRRGALAWAALTVLCLAAIMLGGAWGQPWQGVPARLALLYAYTQPLVIGAALGLFRLALAWRGTGSLARLSAGLAPLSLALYLVHPAVLWALARWAPPLELAPRAALVLLLSLALSALLLRLRARAG